MNTIKSLLITVFLTLSIGLSGRSVLEFDSQQTTHEDAAKLMEVGQDYFQKSNYSKALVYFSKARNIVIKGDGEEAEDLGGIYSLIGLCYFQMGKIDVAVDNMEKGVRIWKMYDNICHEGGLYTCYVLALLYFTNHDDDKALVYYTMAAEIGSSILDEENALLAEIYERLGLLYGIDDEKKSLQYYKYSLNIYQRILKGEEKIEKVKELSDMIKILEESIALDEEN